MVEFASVSTLINDIYDAALDARVWPRVLQRTLALLDASSAVLYSQDASSQGSFACSVGTDPEFARRYVAHYMHLDPILAYEQGLAPGAVFAASDALPYEELCASAFFNEWVRPQGYVDFVAVVLDKAASGLAKVLFNRDARQGLVDERARRTMRLLAPHLQRAVRLGKVLERHASQTAGLSEALDSLCAGALLIDGAGRLLHANRFGRQYLDAGDALYWSAGRPQLRDAGAAAQLQAALTVASGNAEGSTREPLRGGHRSDHAARATVQVLPLTAGTRRAAAAPCTAVAAVIVSPAGPDAAQRVPQAARRYGLTPAEARVVQALMNGCTIGRAAGLLGIGEATVKTHLQHIFDKTHARRQAQLIKLIAEFPPGQPQPVC